MARSRTTRPDDCPYVGKGGLKLRAALDAFALAPTDLVCADLGSHIGGFTDCLLQAGAARVHSVDTGYGTLAWTLRNDPRVVVHERVNALHWDAPEPLDLIVADLGWTPQRHLLPLILRLLRPGASALSLVKPQYEVPRASLPGGVLPADRLPEVLSAVRDLVPPGLSILAEAPSPVRGSGGNSEWWLLLQRQDFDPSPSH